MAEILIRRDAVSDPQSATALMAPRRTEVTGHPDFGVPFGQDLIVPIFVARRALSGGRARAQASLSAHGQQVKRRLETQT